MKKALSEMTPEELWQLFPIYLTEHKDNWEAWYNEEVKILQSLLQYDIRFHHIDSTTIKGIFEKTIVDILISAAMQSEIRQIAEILQKNGYIIMSSNENRISLNKGYTEDGFAEKVFHLHLRLKDDINEIYFRDYLNAHQDIAKEYEKLKLKLWKKYEHNRDAYTNAKTEFVKKYTELAKHSI